MTLLMTAALPLVAAAILAVARPRIDRRGSVVISSVALLLSLGSTVALAQALATGRASLLAEIASWLPIRGADLVLELTPTTLPLVVAATATTAVIALSSWRARQTPIYQMALLVGAAALVLLFTGANLILIAAAYGALSLASYAAATHDQERAAAAVAAERTFVIDRVADGAFVLATLGYFGLFRTVDLAEMASRVVAPRIADPGFVVPSVLLVTAVLAKSAQLPFHARAVALRERPLGLAAFGALAVAATAVALLRVGLVIHPGVLAAAAALGALTAAISVALAATRPSGKEALACGAAAPAGIEIVAIGAGAKDLAIAVFIASAVALAVLAMVAATGRPRLHWRGLGGRRARRALADGLGLAPLWTASARTYGAAAHALEQGTDVAIDRALAFIATTTLRAGRLVAHAEAGPSWRLEAIGLAALVALVAYWSLR